MISKRRKAILELVRRLEFIQVVKGYSCDAGLNILLGERPAFGPDDPESAISLAFGPDDPTTSGGLVRRRTPIEIHAMVRADLEEPLITLEQLICDIRAAVEIEGRTYYGQIAASGVMAYTFNGALPNLPNLSGLTVTIGAQTYVFSGGILNLGEVRVEGDRRLSFDNLADAINTTDTPGTGENNEFGKFYVPLNADVTAVHDNVAHTITLTAKVAGAAGNSIAFGGTAIVAGGTLAGGSDGQLTDASIDRSLDGITLPKGFEAGPIAPLQRDAGSPFVGAIVGYSATFEEHWGGDPEEEET